MRKLLTRLSPAAHSLLLDTLVFGLFFTLTTQHASSPALADRFLLAFGVALTTHLLRAWR